MDELQARDLRAWCPLMHAAWSGSADVFRSVVMAIEDNLGRDQVSIFGLPFLLRRGEANVFVGSESDDRPRCSTRTVFRSSNRYFSLFLAFLCSFFFSSAELRGSQ